MCRRLSTYGYAFKHFHTGIHSVPNSAFDIDAYSDTCTQVDIVSNSYTHACTDTHACIDALAYGDTHAITDTHTAVHSNACFGPDADTNVPTDGHTHSGSGDHRCTQYGQGSVGGPLRRD